MNQTWNTAIKRRGVGDLPLPIQELPPPRLAPNLAQKYSDSLERRRLSSEKAWKKGKRGRLRVHNKAEISWTAVRNSGIISYKWFWKLQTSSPELGKPLCPLTLSLEAYKLLGHSY